MSCTWLTVMEATSMAKVDRSALYRWMKDGRLPYKILPSDRRLICMEDLLRESSEAKSMVTRNSL